MKKKYIFLIIFGIICLLSLSYIGFTKLNITTNWDRVKVWCKENKISDDKCYIETPGCFYDCEKLGLEFFRFKPDGNECHCLELNSTKRIW